MCRYFALVLVGLPSVNLAFCADLDCLLVCSPYRALPPLILVLCLLQWLSSVTFERVFFIWLALFEYSPSGSFVPSCVLCAIHAFLCGSSIKIGCCKLGPVWPCLSPPAPTLIHRCSSNFHAQALSAWVVFRAPYKKKRKYVYLFSYFFVRCPISQPRQEEPPERV